MDILNKEAFSFLSFNDYFKSNENRDKDWITVARMDPASSKDPMLVFSVIINKKYLENVIKSEDWEIDNLQMGEGHFEFGHPYFSRSDDNVIQYIEGWGKSNEVVIEPFVFYRLNDGLYESSFEILQNFILYHNLRADKKGNFLNPHTEEIIVNKINPEHVLIKTQHLRDYLAATDSILVSYFEFDRRFPLSINKVISIKKYETVCKEPNAIYRLTIKESSLDPSESFSWVRGKEIIFPYAEPLHDSYEFLNGKDEREYEDFVIRLDEGKPVSSRCGIDGDITPCFFKKDLLIKYQEDPVHYTIASNYYISKYNEWYIPYSINDEGLIHVYLKDLGNLPINEQKYWRSFNVPPSGGLNRGFFERNMECKFTASDNPVDVLLSKRDEVNKKFENKYGFKLFRKLSGEDEYIQKITLDLILHNQKQFDNQLLNLTKMFVDSLDKKELENNTDWKPSIENENKSIYFLDHFLTEKKIGNTFQISQVCKGLRILQTLRSAGSAHSKSSEYKKLIEKQLGIEEFNIRDSWQNLIANLIQSMEIFLSILN